MCSCGSGCSCAVFIVCRHGDGFFRPSGAPVFFRAPDPGLTSWATLSRPSGTCLAFRFARGFILPGSWFIFIVLQTRVIPCNGSESKNQAFDWGGS